MEIIDNYSYLLEQGYNIPRNSVLTRDISFIVYIFNKLALNSDQNNIIPSECQPISEKDIFILRKLRNKYELLIDYCDPDEKLYQGLDEFLKAVRFLIKQIFLLGYFHKYSIEDIEKIKEQSSILAISMALSSLKELKIKLQTNHRFVRLCEFHKEKNPSLVLFENTSSYTCFGCNNAGNAVSYLMRAEDLSYLTALETLAPAAGVVLPPNSKAKPRHDITEKILAMYEDEYYQELINRSNQLQEIHEEKNREELKTKAKIYRKTLLLPVMPNFRS